MRSYSCLALLKTSVLTLAWAAAAQAAPALSGLTCNPSTVNVGTSTACTVSLSAPALSPTLVYLAKDSVGITVPGSVTVPAGSAQGSFSVSAASTAVSHTANVRASYAGVGVSTPLSVVSTTPQLVGFVCAPLTVSPGASTSCTLTLSLPAPATGAMVIISSSSASVSIPSRVTIPPNATSTPVNAVVSSAAPSGSVALTAIYGALSRRVILTVGGAAATPPPPQLSGLVCSPATMSAGASSTCTVSLSSAAPATGFPVAIAKSGTGTTAPASVTVPPNAASVQFAVASATSTPAQTMTVTATAGSIAKSAAITITATAPAAQLSGLVCSPATINAGASSTCTVSLSSAAPATGFPVAIAKSGTGTTAPASVTVPPNVASVQFAVASATSTPAQTMTVTATAGSIAKSAAITITAAAPAAQLSGLVCSPATINAGASSTCTVSLSSAAPATGFPVAIAKTGTGTTAPASVTVPANAASVQFAVASATSTPAQTMTVTATAGSITKSASITIGTLSGPQLSSIVCTPANIIPGASSGCTVTLTAAAPSGGLAVYVTSTGTGLSFPASFTMPGGRTSIQFGVTTTATTPNQTTAINARIGSVTKTAPLTIATIPLQINSFTCTPETVASGASAQCIGRFNTDVPAGGVSATVSSSSGNLSVPRSLTIEQGYSAFQFEAASSEQTATLETVTVTVTVQQQTVSATVKINPFPAFYLKGNTQEISSLMNGASVRATAAPATLKGALTVRGNGYMSFDPVVNGQGIDFHPGASQATNTAFIEFTGQDVGTMFPSQGEISFFLKSAYSFAERAALPKPNNRYVFAAQDESTVSQFHFMTYTNGSQLVFGYSTRGNISFYEVPLGQEDRLFGRDVVMKVKIAWSGNTNELYLNDQLVRSIPIRPQAVNWVPQSTLTIGANGSRTGGAYASDDAIAEFKIR